MSRGGPSHDGAAEPAIRSDQKGGRFVTEKDKFKGGHRGRTADPGHQFRLSIPADTQAVMAYATGPDAGPGGGLSRSEALYVSPDQRAN